MEEMKEYIEVAEKSVACCRDMLSQEQEKRRALLGNDQKRLEAVLKNQQAAVMKLDSLEKRRLAAQEKLGLGGKSAEEVLAALPQGAQKDRLAELFGEMSGSCRELRELNKTALGIARENLRLMEQMTGSIPQGQAGLYTRGRQTDARGGLASSFEEKI